MLRHQLIENLVTQETPNVAEVAVAAWERLAMQLISIIGEGGFNALYLRSVFLTQATFPNLVTSLKSPKSEHHFSKLKTSLEQCTPGQAMAANRLLLITFTDILASLIGEQLTNSILYKAWGNDASESTGKEY